MKIIFSQNSEPVHNFDEKGTKPKKRQVHKLHMIGNHYS